MKIRLGFSTCPNDTFMFDALVNGRIDVSPIEFDIVMADIFHLNQMVLAGELDMIKISYNAFGKVRETYQLLEAGSALGYNCGPLLITQSHPNLEEIVEQNLPVAIPGENTTANMLLGFFAPELRNKKAYIFDEIMPAILTGEVAAGVIIHENRFTYKSHGLSLIQDLGEYWEQQTSFPIPLGAIVAKKSLDSDVIERLNDLMKKSVEYAFSHPTDSMPFVSQHAQEMDEVVMKSHIDLYVNDFSKKLGPLGHQAVEKLLAVGEEMGLYS